MRYTEDSHIATLEEVREFVSYLVNDLRISIHPDNDFADYVETGTDKQTFTTEEIKIGNRLMGECFITCEKCGVDMYELCLPILTNAVFGKE